MGHKGGSTRLTQRDAAPANAWAHIRMFGDLFEAAPECLIARHDDDADDTTQAFQLTLNGLLDHGPAWLRTVKTP